MVNNKPHKQNRTNPPRRAYTPPNIAASVLFVILSLFISWFFGSPYSLALFIVYFSWWLVPLLLYTSYYFGLTIAKSSHKSFKDYVYLKTISIQIIIIVIQLLITITVWGYPIKFCASTCLEVSIIAEIAFLAIMSIIGFAPAYYAIFRYSKWCKIICQNKKNHKKDYPGAIFG